MSNISRRHIQWQDVMAASVTLLAILGFAGFVALITMLLSNNSTSMSEVLWGRYVYLLAGIETLTFTAVGWLFRKSPSRAGRSSTTAGHRGHGTDESSP